jgi:hypothetical protein
MPHKGRTFSLTTKPCLGADLAFKRIMSACKPKSVAMSESGKEKELLAQFHHTISEQLDSRLSESPKFFGLLVIVSTGYGYVLSDSKFSKFLTRGMFR